MNDFPHLGAAPVAMLRSSGWDGEAGSTLIANRLSASAAPAAEPSCKHGAELHHDATPLPQAGPVHPALPEQCLRRERDRHSVAEPVAINS